MTTDSSLQHLARLVGGEPRVAVTRLLTLVCEQLAMDLAFVTVRGDDGDSTVRLPTRRDGTPGVLGPEEVAAAAWCGRAAEHGPLLVQDAREELADAAPLTAAAWIVSYAGVPLVGEGGTVIGALCAVGHEPHTSLNTRDGDMLTGLAAVIAPLARGLDRQVAPSQQPPGLAAVAASVDGADDLERLSRPLIDALRGLTGLSSAYLTAIDLRAGVQEIRYAANGREDFEIPEGLVVPWEDTLCKRALDEGSPVTTDVPGVWGDNAAAQALGIQSYVSVPVSMSDGRVWGTLCAADSVAPDDVAAHLPTMRLFARLIAAEVEREAAVQQARAEADSDALTGCSSRRVAQPWLAAQVASLSPDEVVAVAFIDLDGFKGVNDTLGHAAGDAVLVQVGHRLRAAARPHDLVCRLGGDEFLVAVRVPRGTEDSILERVADATNFSMDWQGTPVEVRSSIGIAVSDGNDPAALVAAADARMYAHKSSR
ncbi:sensor domain-containing diguanylate cyclase [Phycicoccus duodecadis]|uniref:Diguanylate cyclase (GGDEF)-like protein n=1 Tax=Phycicoccus duodecadis TaxID=173053 RepID=A0A2N3YKX1_9MICO|nr:sensor domain-containing diguanylate cyclase [Phycicoccus duodecadis]PKW27511.1 diguanylate cyclase (GGDEF)-like protein [Phycicoccus duodecadis]